MIKVLLVDDQVLFAKSLAMTISNYADDIEIVDIAKDGKEAIDMARKYHPDVILMDVYMKKMDGVSATRVIHLEFPDIRILMLSTYSEDENVRLALIYGASGYLLKDISPTELLISIRSLKSGIFQISPLIVESLIRKKYIEDRASDNNTLSEITKVLTKRELEIFSLIAIGYENDMIGQKLYLSSQTVRNYVSSIYEKTGCKDRFEIIRLANKV